MDEALEHFIDTLNEDNRRLLSMISSPYNDVLSGISQGTGVKKYSDVIKATIDAVLSKDPELSQHETIRLARQNMAKLYMYRPTNATDVRTNAILDNIDTGELLLDQDMTFGLSQATGVWRSVRDTLVDKGFTGIIVPDTREQLDDLYMSIKMSTEAERAALLNDTIKTTDYIAVSYVQTKSQDGNRRDLMPSFWSETIIEAIATIRRLGVFPMSSNIGVWWDKLASIQYSGAQRTWPATANLQFPTHMTLVCLPMANKHDYDVPLWSDTPATDSLVENVVSHIRSCPVCSGVPMVYKCGTLVSPTMVRRCWPFMEINLANLNGNAYITARHMGHLVDTIRTLMFIWWACCKVSESEFSTWHPYNMYADSASYCQDIAQRCNDGCCDHMLSVVRGSLEPDINSVIRVHQELNDIIGLLDNLTVLVKPLEVYIDADKNGLNQMVRLACRHMTELVDDEDYNTSLIRDRLSLETFDGAAVADAINDVMNGFSCKSLCYSNADKVVAAISLMDVKLTQQVLLDWEPESRTHPLAGLFTEDNWGKICTSDNMSSLLTKATIGKLRDVHTFWLGCMQSEIGGDIFMEAMGHKVFCFSDDTIHMIQKTLQYTFIDKINIKGRYYEGEDACIQYMKCICTGVGECTRCAGIDTQMDQSGEVIGRYTLLATKQLRGLTNCVMHGDTQVVILRTRHDALYAYKLANINLTLNNDFVVTCPVCKGMSMMVTDYYSRPIGVITVHYMDGDEALRTRHTYAASPVIMGYNDAVAN